MPLPARFSQADLEAALAAAQKSGPNTRVRITPEGEILIEVSDPEPIAEVKTPRPSIYLFENAGRVKIGYSQTPDTRILHFSMAIGREVAFCALVAGTWRDEKRLHHHFRDHRVFGEWFEIAGPVAELMTSPQENLERLLNTLRGNQHD